MRVLHAAAVLACAWLLIGSTVHAQSWPARPMRVIVPFPAGGGTDLVGRLVAAKLADDLGQPAVVDNRPGAGGVIGADIVAKATADGYTTGIATSSTHPAAVVLRKDVPYDPLKSFTPITMVAVTSYVLVGSPALPAQNLRELVAHLKANPGKLNFGDVGQSTLGYLLSQQFKALTGTALVDISYKGSSQIYPDLISNQVALFLDNPGTSTALVNAGRLKAFGVTRPTPSMPKVPLFADAGLAGFDAAFWYGLVAPAGTPKAVIDRMQSALEKYLRSAQAKSDLDKVGLEPAGGSAAGFANVMRTDMDRFRALAKQLNITPQ